MHFYEKYEKIYVYKLNKNKILLTKIIKKTEHKTSFGNIYYISWHDITHAFASDVLFLQFYIHTPLLISATHHRTVTGILVVNSNPALLNHDFHTKVTHVRVINLSTYACEVPTRTGATVLT